MILDGTSPEEQKKALKQDSQAHREAFEQELSILLSKAKKVATTALVIGGSFAITYYVIKKFSGEKKVLYKKNGSEGTKEVIIQKKSSIPSKIKSLVFTEVAVFLLAIAKEKLMAYLEKHNTPENEHAKDA